MYSSWTDVDPQSLPPLWPFSPEPLFVENYAYELKAVPITSVVLVTDRTVKVDVTGIVDTHCIEQGSTRQAAFDMETLQKGHSL